MGTSFRLEKISQLLSMKRNSESSLARVCDLSVESDVRLMHEWIFRWWEQTQDIGSLCQWSILVMVHMRFLKRKSRTQVGDWIYSSRHSWSCLIKCSAGMRHWMMSEFWGNVVRIHYIHSTQKSFLEQLWMNVSMCIDILTRWLSIQSLKHLDEFSKIIQMCSWTIEVQSNY
jgi:hypothetical protein